MISRRGFFRRLFTRARGRSNSAANADSASLDGAGESGSREKANFQIYAHPVNGPRSSSPPKYLKVHARHRKAPEFPRLFLAQELLGSRRTSAFASAAASREPQAIWSLVLSRSGRFLAAAGQNTRIHVWMVISSPAERQAHELEEDIRDDPQPMRLRAPVFKTQAAQTYDGHTGTVVDLSWSKNDFLLSTSMDKSVRLWHVSRNECLCCFKHSDFVTSVEFHPRDDRFFLAGSLDGKLRLWTIPDKSVAFETHSNETITAVAFTPDGKYALVGLLNGLCVIYSTDGLRIVSQIVVRAPDPAVLVNVRSHKRIKITGIDSIFLPSENPYASTGSLKLLVTSNDSCIRLYNFRDRALEAQFRGNEIMSSQIRATFSSDGRYVICGSEDRQTYIWPMVVPEGRSSFSGTRSTHALVGTRDRDTDRRGVEMFEAHRSVVTNAIMASVRTKQILGATGDSLYDTCNPPGSSMATGPAGPTAATTNSLSPTPGGSFSHQKTRNISNTTNNSTATTTNGGGGGYHRRNNSASSHQSSSMQSSISNFDKSSRKARSGGNGGGGGGEQNDEEANYLAHGSHPNGNIIITSDVSGVVRVFRQDCAFYKQDVEPVFGEPLRLQESPTSLAP